MLMNGIRYDENLFIIWESVYVLRGFMNTYPDKNINNGIWKLYIVFQRIMLLYGNVRIFKEKSLKYHAIICPITTK